MDEHEIEERRLAKLKHALGMNGTEHSLYEAYRRSSFYNEPDEVWESLRKDGLAKRIMRDDGKEYIYAVTDKGMQYVANATGLTLLYKLTFTPQ